MNVLGQAHMLRRSFKSIKSSFQQESAEVTADVDLCVFVVWSRMHDFLDKISFVWPYDSLIYMVCMYITSDKSC